MHLKMCKYICEYTYTYILYISIYVHIHYPLNPRTYLHAPHTHRQTVETKILQTNMACSPRQRA